MKFTTTSRAFQRQMKVILPCARLFSGYEVNPGRVTISARGNTIMLAAANRFLAVRLPLEGEVIESGEATVDAVELGGSVRAFAPEAIITVEEIAVGHKLAISDGLKNVMELPCRGTPVPFPAPDANVGADFAVKRKLLLLAKTILTVGTKRSLDRVYDAWSLWVSPKRILMAGGDGRIHAAVESPNECGDTTEGMHQVCFWRYCTPALLHALGAIKADDIHIATESATGFTRLTCGDAEFALTECPPTIWPNPESLLHGTRRYMLSTRATDWTYVLRGLAASKVANWDNQGRTGVHFIKLDLGNGGNELILRAAGPRGAIREVQCEPIGGSDTTPITAFCRSTVLSHLQRNLTAWHAETVVITLASATEPMVIQLKPADTSRKTRPRPIFSIIARVIDAGRYRKPKPPTSSPTAVPSPPPASSTAAQSAKSCLGSAGTGHVSFSKGTGEA